MRKQFRFIIMILVFTSVFIRCEKVDDFSNTTTDAEIIGFIPEKCYCCWGWEIKVGNDVIKSDSLPNAELIGYSIEKPISVIISIGKKKIDCSSSGHYHYDYYEIEKLVLKD